MTKNKQEKPKKDCQIAGEPKRACQLRAEKPETPEKETKEIAYGIISKEMAGEASSLSTLKRDEEHKKERCRRT